MGDGSPLMRESLGAVLRAERMRRGLTLRELSASARISLGYISELERGPREVSSDLLAAMCEAVEGRVFEGRRVVSLDLASAEAATTADSGDVVASAA